MFKTTPEKKAEQEEARARRAAEREQAKAAQQEARARAAAAKAREQFLSSPVGRARTAFERGDRLFQYSASVMTQQAVIVAMVGSTVNATSSDPCDILNAVCGEGWELVNGSFVFLMQGEQSRDKFMSSGQNVAVKGETVGYYLFRRCEANRVS